MTNTIEEKTQQWFVDRNLHTQSPVKQFLKLMEETGELFEGMSKNSKDLIFDALGDMQVVLIGMEMQPDNLEKDLLVSRKEIVLLEMVLQLGRIARDLNDYSKTPLPSIKHAIRQEIKKIRMGIWELARYYQTTDDRCLEIAYEEIKDRKGKMIDGVFVKEADLSE